MNYLILNQYGITFQKQNNGNLKIKANSLSLGNFMYMICRDKQKLVKLVSSLNQVIVNGINSISDEDKYYDVEIGDQDYTGEIFCNTEFELYFENEENETFPLSDIKEIMESLLEFLQS